MDPTLSRSTLHGVTLGKSARSGKVAPGIYKFEFCGSRHRYRRETRVELRAMPGRVARSSDPARTFIVHQLRYIRILEQGPIPQHGNVTVLSRASGSDPGRYEGNRNSRNVMVCVATSLGPKP